LSMLIQPFGESLTDKIVIFVGLAAIIALAVAVYFLNREKK
jgi:hypothetical protein